MTPSVQGYPFVFPYLRLGLPVVLLAALAGCGPDYSPNTYSTDAVQQANKVDQGVVAGFREVAIRSDGTIGAVAGGAAGGVLGAQTPEGGVVTALSAIGGTIVGGLVGASVERAADDAKGFEYIVRKTNGDLLSVTQKDMTPLAIGLKVLIIEGKQARVVPDYTVPADTHAPAADEALGKSEKHPAETKGSVSAKSNATETDKTANGVTATVAPSDTKPPPAQTPPPTATASPPVTPASNAADSAPASQPVTPQGPAPQAAPTPAPATDPQPAQADQTSSTTPPAAATQAPAADPQPAQANQDSSATPPTTSPQAAPAPSDGKPTP